MGKIYIAGDFHFFHKKVLEYNPSRKILGITEENIINQLIILNEKDLFINLGDLFLGNSLELDNIAGKINKIKCKQFLIKGNHDDKSKNWFIENFKFNKIENYIKIKNILFIHHPKYINTLGQILNLNNYNEFFIFHGHMHEKNMVESFLKNKKENNLFYLNAIKDNKIENVYQAEKYGLIFDIFEYNINGKIKIINYFNASIENMNGKLLDITKIYLNLIKNKR